MAEKDKPEPLDWVIQDELGRIAAGKSTIDQAADRIIDNLNIKKGK